MMKPPRKQDPEDFSLLSDFLPINFLIPGISHLAMTPTVSPGHKNDTQAPGLREMPNAGQETL
jgi:hypothetical protein